MAEAIQQVAELAQIRYSDTEVPLRTIVADIMEDPKAYAIQRSKAYPSSYLMWDPEKDNVIIATHAFVIRYLTPIDTGNFVPEGKPLPIGLLEYMRKSEPGPTAQISLTFDVRMDDTLHPSLVALEDWATTEAGFKVGKKRRNTWMSPSYVYSNLRYTVTSQLFQSKNAFNCKEDGYSVSYDVHPWIEEASFPNNDSYIPNPNLVQFFDVENDEIIELKNSSDPSLGPGDLVKMTFKIAFILGQEQWNMSFIPVQVMRVGKVDSSMYAGSAVQVEDHGRIPLLKPGTRLSDAIYPQRQRPSKGKGKQRAKLSPIPEEGSETMSDGDVEESSGGTPPDVINVLDTNESTQKPTATKRKASNDIPQKRRNVKTKTKH